MSTKDPRHTTTTDEIATVRAALGLDDAQVRIEISRTGWDHATCEITGTPAAVDIRFYLREGGETSIMVAADQVAEQVEALDYRDDVDLSEGITLDVSYWWLRYAVAVPAAA
ncbi:hypothetical protein [Nocardia abscessus]|uniref:hypothetical protein n=1 Tax=Nocardia abscessus TaxID=120957 RepID=UPI002454E491|nr:hypothetical protein [Nocardia abscessus]